MCSLTRHSGDVTLCEMSLLLMVFFVFQLWTISQAGAVMSVDFSPDGRRIVCGSANSVMIWDVETREEVRDFGAGVSRMLRWSRCCAGVSLRF